MSFELKDCSRCQQQVLLDAILPAQTGDVNALELLGFQNVPITCKYGRDEAGKKSSSFPQQINTLQLRISSKQK